MKKILSFTLVCSLLACQHTQETQYRASKIGDDWHTAILRPFQLELPRTFQYKNENSPDSFAGKFENGKQSVSFDYGYFSTPLGDEASYIASKQWLHDTSWGSTLPDIGKIKVLEFWKDCKQGNCKHLAKVRFRDSTWVEVIKIPRHLQNSVAVRDTLGGVVRETLYNAQKHIEAIRLTSLDDYNPSMNAYKALAVSFHEIEDNKTAQAIAKSIALRMKGK